MVAGWMDSDGHCRNIMNPNWRSPQRQRLLRRGLPPRLLLDQQLRLGTSTAVDDVVPLIVTTAAPRIEDTPTVGKKLTAKPGSWGPKGREAQLPVVPGGQEDQEGDGEIR